MSFLRTHYILTAFVVVFAISFVLGMIVPVLDVALGININANLIVDVLTIGFIVYVVKVHHDRKYQQR